MEEFDFNLFIVVFTQDELVDGRYQINGLCPTLRQLSLYAGRGTVGVLRTFQNGNIIHIEILLIN